ncbi:hypothetical protein OOY67_004115 [Vibrio parahaemolyticus]|nr:hypothetical protein [Vibrio parahaemolyticus]HCH3619883.1 hypothetical protein [Vibrio parahaemolyticus]
MVDEFFTSIKAYLYDRASSPLLGALIVGLFVWNLKIVMLFFSSTSYSVKVWEIDHFYAQPFFMFKAFGFEEWALSNYICCVYVMPMFTALFYIYVFPFFSHKVFEHSYNKQIALNNARKKLQGSEVLTQEEKAEVMSQLEKMKLKSRQENLQLKQEITELESQLDTVVVEKSELETSLTEITNAKDQLQDENKKLRDRLSVLKQIHGEDDEVKSQRNAHGKELISSLRERIKSKASSGNDDSSNEDTMEDNLDTSDSIDYGHVKDNVDAGDSIDYGYVKDNVDTGDSIDHEPVQDDNFSFYEKAIGNQREIFRSILNALYLGDKTYADFSHTQRQLDSYLPPLLMNDLVIRANKDTFQLTDKGRRFLKTIN